MITAPNATAFRTRRAFAAPDARIKFTRKTFDDGKSPMVTLTGYPIVWGDISSDRGGYKVRLTKGAAAFTDQVYALWHHDFSKLLAGTGNKTLRIGQADDYGLPVEMDLDANTTAGRDAAAYVASGLVNGMSFCMANGFEDYSESTEDGQTIITCTKFTVDEVTITAIPAFAGTQIGVKDEDADKPNPPTPAGGMSQVEGLSRINAFVQAQKLRLAMVGL